ncbi:uncharacterized protein LOC142233716 [Haematobia irritans]|uniref:uncharacterized protein LOC142233716 n=1 Tax=Haematobia irritans TaxID=7368 RepID=UPI003F4FC602
MQAFIVLSLVAVACAQYNYQPTSGIGGDAHAAQLRIGGGSSGGFNQGFHNGPNDFGSSAHSAPQSGAVDNQFITYTVDEKDFQDPEAQRTTESLKAPSRVVFIRGPSNKGLEDALLNLGKLAAPQTAIYVLNKQSDLAELANKLNSVNDNNNNRPEVHFVKYRTPEDAANAQAAIQGQYDALGGSSKTINGGVAASLNFASQAPAARSSSHEATAPANSYLPASVLRLFRH